MQEIDRKKLLELLKQRNKLHPLDDIGLQKIWNELLLNCGTNEKEIVNFLFTLNKNDLVSMSEIFEDISIKLNKSKTFKNALEEITSKYPDINFSLEYC